MSPHPPPHMSRAEREALRQSVRGRARLYARISDDPEGRELGVQRQLEDARALAAILKVEVVGEHVDNDVSASTLSKKPRPEFDRLLAEAAADPGSRIVAYSNSRLTRRPSEWEGLIQLYERTRVTVHTVASGSIDLSTADGRAVARTIAAWDAAQAERISELAKRENLQRAEAGLPRTKRRAFGWRDDTHLDPVEHPIVEDWSRRVLAGESVRNIVADMAERGVTSVRGNPFTITGVRKILTAPRVAGWRTYHDEIITRGTWEPALPEDMWRQLVALFGDPGRRTATFNSRVHLLTRLALHDECLSPVTTMNGRKYSCDECHMTRTIAPIDDYVNEYMRQRVKLVEFEPDPGVDPVAVAEAERLRGKIADLKAAFAGDDSTATDFLDVFRNLKTQLAAVEARTVPPPRAKVLAAAAAGEWDGFSVDQKRAILAELVEVRLSRSPKGRNGFDPATVELIPR